MASLLRDVKIIEHGKIDEEEGNELIFGLQVLEAIAPSLNKSILPPALDRLPHLCNLLAHPYKAVRHMAARCVATLAKLNTEKVIFLSSS